MTRAEQETILRWDEDEQMVSLWSASPRTWRKAAKLGLIPVKVTQYRGEVTGHFYELPLSRLRWGLKRDSGRPGNAEALARHREAKRHADTHETETP